MDDKAGWYLGRRYSEWSNKEVPIGASPFALAASTSLCSIASDTTVEEETPLIPSSEVHCRNAHLLGPDAPISPLLSGPSAIHLPDGTAPWRLRDLIIIPVMPILLINIELLRARTMEAFFALAKYPHTLPFWISLLTEENFDDFFAMFCTYSPEWWLEMLCGDVPPDPADVKDKPYVDNAMGSYWKFLLSLVPCRHSWSYFGKAAGSVCTNGKFGLGARKIAHTRAAKYNTKGRESQSDFSRKFRKDRHRFKLGFVSIFAIPIDPLTASELEIRTGRIGSAMAEAVNMEIMQNWRAENKPPAPRRIGNSFWPKELFNTYAKNGRNPLCEPMEDTLNRPFIRTPQQRRERRNELLRIRNGTIKRLRIFSAVQKEISFIAKVAKRQWGRIRSRQVFEKRVRDRKERILAAAARAILAQQKLIAKVTEKAAAALVREEMLRDAVYEQALVQKEHDDALAVRVAAFADGDAGRAAVIASEQAEKKVAQLAAKAETKAARTAEKQAAEAALKAEKKAAKIAAKADAKAAKKAEAKAAKVAAKLASAASQALDSALAQVWKTAEAQAHNMASRHVEEHFMRLALDQALKTAIEATEADAVKLRRVMHDVNTRIAQEQAKAKESYATPTS